MSYTDTYDKGAINREMKGFGVGTLSISVQVTLFPLKSYT